MLVEHASIQNPCRPLNIISYIDAPVPSWKYRFFLHTIAPSTCSWCQISFYKAAMIIQVDQRHLTVHETPQEVLDTFSHIPSQSLSPASAIVYKSCVVHSFLHQNWIDNSRNLLLQVRGNGRNSLIILTLGTSGVAFLDRSTSNVTQTCKILEEQLEQQQDQIEWIGTIISHMVWHTRCTALSWRCHVSPFSVVWRPVGF